MKNVGEFQVVRNKVYEIKNRIPNTFGCVGCAGEYDNNTCLGLGECDNKIAVQVKPNLRLNSFGWSCLSYPCGDVGDTPQIAYNNWLSRYESTKTSEMDTPLSIPENNRSHILGLNFAQTLAYGNILHAYNCVLLGVGNLDGHKFYASAKFETAEDMLNFQMKYL